jgi:hypothetical protein
MYKTYRCRLTHDEAWQDLGGRLYSLKTGLVLQDTLTYEKCDPRTLVHKSEFIDLLLVDMERLVDKIAEFNYRF